MSKDGLIRFLKASGSPCLLMTILMIRQSSTQTIYCKTETWNSRRSCRTLIPCLRPFRAVHQVEVEAEASVRPLDEEAQLSQHHLGGRVRAATGGEEVEVRFRIISWT